MRKFKINRGTYNAINENIEQIGENELIITTDKNIPVPTENDNNKVLQVSNGDYDLGNPNLDNFAQGTTNKYLNASEYSNVQNIPSMAEIILAKQDAITNENKLSSDLVDDTNHTNKFVSAGEKQTWNNKSSVSVSNTGTATDEVEYITIDGVENKLGGVGIDDSQTSANKTWSSQKINSELSNKQNTINSSNKVNADYVDDSNSTNKFVSAQDKTNWNNKVDKTSNASKVYGTDANGNQTTYDLGSLGSSGAVKYNESQTLTDNEKLQARTNIGINLTYTILGDND